MEQKTQSSWLFLKHIEIGWFKACIQNKLAYYVSFIFSIIYPPDVSSLIFYRVFYPWTPTRAAPWIHCESYSAFRSPPLLQDHFVIVFLWNITFKELFSSSYITIRKNIKSRKRLFTWGVQWSLDCQICTISS